MAMGWTVDENGNPAYDEQDNANPYGTWQQPTSAANANGGGNTAPPTPTAPDPNAVDPNAQPIDPNAANGNAGNNAPAPPSGQSSNPYTPPPTQNINTAGSNGAQPPTAPTAPNGGSPTFTDFERDYWAPDRQQVLYDMLKKDYWAGDRDAVLAKYAPTNATGNTTATSTANTPGAVPPGFDATKWNDPNKHDPKYDVGRLVASGASNDAIAKMLTSTYPGWKIAGNDKIQDPQGNLWDFRFDQEGANKPQWISASGTQASTGGASANVANTLMSRYTNSTGGPSFLNTSSPGLFAPIGLSTGQGGNLGPTASSNKADALWNTLMSRALQGANVDPNDPVIRRQVNAYRAEQQRAARNNLKGQAESKGPYANLSSERRQANAQVGQQTGAMQAQLVSRELQSRRDEIQSALSNMQGLLTSQQQMQLQQQLAQINAALSWAQLQQSAYQFDSNDEFRRSPLAS